MKKLTPEDFRKYKEVPELLDMTMAFGMVIGFVVGIVVTTIVIGFLLR